MDIVMDTQEDSGILSFKKTIYNNKLNYCIISIINFKYIFLIYIFFSI